MALPSPHLHMLPVTARICAEAVGTAMLLAIVVGSGIMGETLADGNDAVALLANCVATGAGLFVLVSVLGPVSGAHFNPAVTVVARIQGKLLTIEAAAYVVAQIVGAVAGVWVAHAMFGEPIVQFSSHVRGDPGLWLSEVIATVGLLATILGGGRSSPDRVPALVASWIVCAYWFTASTSFANPAVTLARMLTDTFAGIQPIDAPAFVIVQLLTAVVVGLVWRRWHPEPA